MIIGTAGHIDHGKTSLVKALTGIDTDRLKEEKRRGITLELGFAHLQLDDGTVAGVVDVPGHERFVKAMVAGAGGVDLAVLVVAADEGVMPQTREHLDICRLLGVKAGVIALTKSDLLAELGAEWRRAGGGGPGRAGGRHLPGGRAGGARVLEDGGGAGRAARRAHPGREGTAHASLGGPRVPPGG